MECETPNISEELEEVFIIFLYLSGGGKGNCYLEGGAKLHRIILMFFYETTHSKFSANF